MNRWHFVLMLVIVALVVTIVAPLILVGSLINRWTPSDLIGYAIALGLSLAVVINSILTKWRVQTEDRGQGTGDRKTKRARKSVAVRLFGKRSFSEIALYILASSEVMVSSSEMMMTADRKGELGAVTLVGIIGVALILEFTLLSSGNALREVLGRIAAESDRAARKSAKRSQEQKDANPSATKVPAPAKPAEQLPVAKPQNNYTCDRCGWSTKDLPAERNRQAAFAGHRKACARHNGHNEQLPVAEVAQ